MGARPVFKSSLANLGDRFIPHHDATMAKCIKNFPFPPSELELMSVCRMSLWDVAEFLKKNGVINAINLDGGGSSTYVTGGSLASYPSDHWSAS